MLPLLTCSAEDILLPSTSTAISMSLDVPCMRSAAPPSQGILSERKPTWTGSGSCLVTPFAISRSSRSGRLACSLASAPDRAPTGSCVLPLYCVGSDTCSITTTNQRALFALHPAFFSDLLFGLQQLPDNQITCFSHGLLNMFEENLRSFIHPDKSPVCCDIMQQVRCVPADCR